MITFFFHWIGLDNGSGRQYLFWSGIFGDVTIFASAILIYVHATCHHSKCLRPFTHPVDGTPWKACKKHHPDIDHTNKSITTERMRTHRDRHPRQ